MNRPKHPFTPRCTCLLLAAVLLATGPAFAQDPSSKGPKTVLGAELIDLSTPYVFDGDLRDLPKAERWKPGDPIREIPRRRDKPAIEKTEPANPVPNVGDPLVDLQRAAQSASKVFGTPDLNFDGLGFSGVNPPDTVGDVGINFYIQAINDGAGTTYVIHNKTDGSVAAGPITLDSFGSGFCGNGFGDPIVLFDHLAGRWLLSEFSSSGNRMCVYISQTGDPISGGWFAYEFQAPSFPDYPKYAVWPDAYYVGTNENNPAAYAMDRSQMLVGGTAGFQRFTASPELGGFGFQMVTPSDVDGPAPPGGSPAYFVRHNDDEAHDPQNNDPANDFIEIFEFHVDFNNAANSSFTGPFQVPIADIDSDLCGLVSFSCIPQPGTSTRLDPLREVVMWRSQYRNFGSHETLIGSLATDVSGSDQSGVRWYELRKSGGGNWTLFQEGTYSIDGDSRWMSSAAMDESGNIAVGYNVGSSSTFPSLRYAGRLASDPAGTLPQGENVLVNGTASNASNRYGDYSSLNVDPVDGCTFWFTGEYNTASQWTTRIGRFIFPGCGGECGNGVREGGEVCDGADLGGATCADFGCAGGTLACGPSCDAFDLSGCTDCPPCNFNGVCDLGEDCNGCSDCVSGQTAGATCGNGVCEAGDGEDCVSCPADCNGSQGGKPANRFCCGDGDGQNPVGCGDSRCTTGGFSCTDVPQPPGSFCCGLFGCEAGETCNNCALDCTLGGEVCSGGVDEDCDGAIDCDDSDCNGDPACEVCTLGQRNDPCTTGADCCSGSCKNNGTCR